ncbi:MAG: DUF2244 domain-containing protein [Minwuia sp.]|uniref:DUF2244 domain-containing protein n=1 Tax=Minwuia sp. TaxID=2493630 RepID=UPI003A872C01
MLETPPDYDFVLHPHRSLGMKGFFLVMGLIGGFSFIAGIVFILQGAWPVMGFLGLDVFLIYVAFRMSYRTGRIRERVVISGGNVTVVRRDARGREQFWEFPAYWARADMETDRRGFGKLYVGSHDRRVRIGAFLTPEELSEFRWTLEDALQLSRATAAPGRG